MRTEPRNPLAVALALGTMLSATLLVAGCNRPADEQEGTPVPVETAPTDPVPPADTVPAPEPTDPNAPAPTDPATPPPATGGGAPPAE